MRKYTAIKRLSALILVLVMALPLTFPVMAARTAPPYQINIRPNKYTSTPGDLEDEMKAQTDYSLYDSCLAWAQAHKTEGNTPAGKLAVEYINLVQRFKAFQIFKGIIDPSSYRDPTVSGNDTSIGSLPANALADVEWGDSVADVSGLVAALIGSTIKLGEAGITPAMLLNESDTYARVLEKAANYKLVTGIGREAWETSAKPAAYEGLNYDAAVAAALQDDMEETLTLGALFTAVGLGGANTRASLVAKVLSDFTPDSVAGNPALARAFAKIATEKNSSAAGGYKYLKDLDDYTSAWDGNLSQWSIGEADGDSDGPLQGGYYLFADTYDESHYGHKDKAQSELILGVFGTVTMTVKASAPSVDKGIVDDNNQANKGDAAEIGDTVTFRLTGTLPENYDTAYDEYKYIFHDTLSKGLTYGSVKQVYVKVYDENGSFGTGGDNDPKYDIYVIDAYSDPGNLHGYQEKKGNDAKHGDTQHTVDFDFQDLKKLQGRKATGIDSDGGYTTGGVAAYADVPVTNSSEIYVEYTATLNEDAVVGYNENYNEVILEYSDNPENSEETNTSTGSRSYVYTFGVEILKYDGSIEEGTPAEHPLEDAGFALTKDAAEKWYQITDTSPAAEPAEPPATPQYKWIRESELKEILGEESELDVLRKTTHGGKTLSELGDDYESGKYAEWYLVFDDDGGEPELVGSMTYYALLKEVVASPKNHYAIVGWVPEADLIDILDQDEKDGKISDTEWAAAITGDKVKAYLSEGFSSQATDEYFLAIKTDSDGYLRIEGMDSGVAYYLREVITPDGFDTIDPVGIQFTATYFTAKDFEEVGAAYPESAEVGHLKDLTYSVNDGDPKDIVKGGKSANSDGETETAGLSVKLEVPNYPAGYLPSTGGRGVYLFYIGGGALLAGAVLYLIFSNRKRNPGKRARYIGREK